MFPQVPPTTAAPFDVEAVVSQMAQGAGINIRDVGTGMIAALIPLAVALLLCFWAVHYAAYKLGFSNTTSERYRDKYRGRPGYEGERYIPERMEYQGEHDGRYYRRRVDSKRRRYDN